MNQILDNHKLEKQIRKKIKKTNATIMDKKQKILVFNRKIRLVCLKKNNFLPYFDLKKP